MRIERGEYQSEAFMQEITEMITALVKTYETVKGAEVLIPKESTVIGKCPVCGSEVSEKAKAFFCADRSCGFALWKNDRYFESIGKSLNKATAQKLLADGWIKLKGCKSRKTGKTFDATVRMEVNDQKKAQFTMEFDNRRKA